MMVLRVVRPRQKWYGEALLWLCIGGLLGFASCGKTVQLSAPSPTSAPTKAGPAVSLRSLQMFDQMQGWAISFDAAHILQTTTGVTGFQDVSPPRLAQSSNALYQVTGSFFLNERLAWISLSGSPSLTAPPPQGFLERTTDGGRNWQETRFSRDPGGLLSFSSAQNGWLLLREGSAAGSEAVEILRTSDGGASWQSVEKTTPSTGSAPGLLPFGGDKTGIVFLDEHVGWITGSNSQFYQTRDGGVTWYVQRLPIPSPVSGAAPASIAEIKPPRFFTAQEGILPVVLVTDDPLQVIYHTHDGSSHLLVNR